MKEKDLIKLGFKRTDVSAEESGGDAFYYYVYEFGDFAIQNFDLITPANDEIINGEWIVYLFNYDKLVFSEKSELKKYIKLVKRNLK